MHYDTPHTSQPASVGIDKKTFWLGVMAVIFAVLLVAHATRPLAFSAPASAAASMAEVVDSRDYSMVSAAQSDGSEAVYVLDKRTGEFGVVIWDPQARRPVPVTSVPLQNQFGR